MSYDDEEVDTVEPSVSLLSEREIVAETPCYGFEEDEEEEDDQEEDSDNEQKQINTVREKKRKRVAVSNKSKTPKKNLVI